MRRNCQIQINGPRGSLLDILSTLLSSIIAVPEFLKSDSRWPGSEGRISGLDVQILLRIPCWPRSWDRKSIWDYANRFYPILLTIPGSGILGLTAIFADLGNIAILRRLWEMVAKCSWIDALGRRRFCGSIQPSLESREGWNIPFPACDCPRQNSPHSPRNTHKPLARISYSNLPGSFVTIIRLLWTKRLRGSETNVPETETE